MNNRRYTEAEVLAKTRELLHLFTDKQIAPFVALLSEDFSWLGDYEPLYLHGLSNFLRSISEERARPPAEIRQEEYRLLAHERSLWVICGRFTVISSETAEVPRTATVHFTLVWQQDGEALKLLHAQGTHAKPLPAPDMAQSRFFEHSQSHAATKPGSRTKISLRDLEGNVHYLFYDEILYVRSDNKQCTFCLGGSHFSVRCTLKELEHEPFLLIHRSYLANASYIKSIRRYTATLADGTELPIGKERYMTLKAALQEGLPI